MKIDIDKLTEAELVDLNNRIIQRLRLLQQIWFPTPADLAKARTRGA